MMYCAVFNVYCCIVKCLMCNVLLCSVMCEMLDWSVFSVQWFSVLGLLFYDVLRIVLTTTRLNALKRLWLKSVGFSMTA